ncbi:hypothetical protein IPP75_01645 [Candidatus Saccharibacteria bacterium]|nr:MAG: hypothetical protein IPP75_01645 [Candidatus Saccharibacteria bacterium]
MSSDLGWRFPALDDSEREGINDSITKAFAGDHEHFIARECIQNSIDHRLDKTAPVRVEFRLKSYPRSVFPAIDELADIVDCCINASSSSRAKEELAVIKKSVSSQQIRTLTVRDYNTEGLTGGDYDEAGSWHRLVRAVGSNDPSGVGGGSYGLGKGAPFAASGIRTVFYATYNEKSENVFQGKTRLVSHMGSDGKMKRGVGFYGARSNDACRSIRTKAEMPAEFVRGERGTDIIIPAYRAVSDNWQLGLVHSVLKNFWPAIHERMLEVEIYDGNDLKQNINAENLAALLEQYPGEETGNAYYYFLAKTSPDKDGYFSEPIDGLGEVELYIKRGDDYPKKVQQMRAPLMVVSSEPYRRALLDPFAAVLICRDEEGNNFLKGLEPPQHDTWDPTLGDDTDVIRNNKRIYKSLQDWVRSKLKSLSRASDGEVMEIPGLAEYLASMERDDLALFGRVDKSDDDPDSETDVERIIPVNSAVSARRPLQYSLNAVKADTGPDEGGSGGSGGGSGRGGGGQPNPGGRSRRLQNRSTIRVRNIGMTPSGEFTDVELCLYSKQPFEGTIRLVAAGEDMNTGIRVLHANADSSGAAYPIKSGRIQNVKIDPSRPTRITARMDGKNIRYAIGVESHKNNS